MITADFDHKDFSNDKQSEQDSKLLVKFFIKPKEDKAQTLAEGRTIFKDVEYVDIRIPGSRTGGACRPATYADKQRFSRHYEMFQKRIEAPEIGTPLSEWTQVSRSQVEELSFYNVKTVENLRDMNDSTAGSFMGGYELKRLAKEWLEKANDTAKVNEIKSLKETNGALQDQIEQMQEFIVALEKKVNTLKPAPKKASKKK